MSFGFCCHDNVNDGHRVKGRPHYYSPKKEEYAHIKFDLDAGWFLPSTSTSEILNVDIS